MVWRLLALAEQLDDGLLRQVFTHSSWVAERGRSYERLEFLGDSVLSLAVTTELYRRFPEHSEGSLARLRAYVVSRATCAKVATSLGLPAFVRRFGAGHEPAELEQLVGNENILADQIGNENITIRFLFRRDGVTDQKPAWRQRGCAYNLSNSGNRACRAKHFKSRFSHRVA